MRHNGAIKTPTLEDVHEALDAIDSQLRDRADVLTNAQGETGAEQLVRTAKAVAYLVVAEEMLRPVLEMLENAGPIEDGTVTLSYHDYMAGAFNE